MFSTPSHQPGCDSVALCCVCFFILGFQYHLLLSAHSLLPILLCLPLQIDVPQIQSSCLSCLMPGLSYRCCLPAPSEAAALSRAHPLSSRPLLPGPSHPLSMGLVACCRVRPFAAAAVCLPTRPATTGALRSRGPADRPAALSVTIDLWARPAMVWTAAPGRYSRDSASKAWGRR